MNGQSGAAGRIWREKELSNKTVTTNFRLSHLAFVTPATCCECKTVFSHLSFTICHCFPILYEQLVLCILSFCINLQKRFARNPPRITFLNMFDNEPEQLRATVCWWDYDDFSCRSRCEWHLFSNLPASCLSTSKGQGLIVEWIRASCILLDVFHDEAK